MDTIFMCRETFHENGLLTFYCKKCKVCICEKCRQTRHTHHTTVDVHQAAEQPKVDIEEVVEEMKRKIADCTERVEKTKESWRKSRESVATSRNKVMTYVEGIIRILQEHEKAMMTSLDVIDGKVQREHAAQLEHLETFRNQLQEHVEWCEGILQRKKNVEILQTHNDFTGRSRGLRNAEKLDIYKPSHVRYEINKENLETVSSVVPEVGRVVISSTDPSQSVAEGTGLQEGDVGSKAIIKITTKDSDGNQCQDENDQIFVKIRPPLEKELIHTIAPVKNGEYSVTYTPDCAGQHEVLIAVNGEPLTGSPWLVHVTPHRYKYSFSLGSCGKGQGQFQEPCSIAIDDVSGKVAVADRKRVQLFSLEGTYLTDVGSKKLTGPSSLAFSKIGELIVIASDKMFCFSESLEFVKYIINKQLKQPHHLTIARDGRMVVCDGGDNTVKILSSDGSQVLLSVCHHDGGKIPVCAVYHQNKIFASYSSGLKVFSKNGAFLYAITYPKSILDFDILQSSFGALAIDRFNNLLIHHRLLCSGLFSSYTEGRIQIFSLDGKLVNTIQEKHTRFRLSDECSVAVSSTGLLFVADFHNHRVHVFQ